MVLLDDREELSRPFPDLGVGGGSDLDPQVEGVKRHEAKEHARHEGDGHDANQAGCDVQQCEPQAVAALSVRGMQPSGISADGTQGYPRGEGTRRRMAGTLDPDPLQDAQRLLDLHVLDAVFGSIVTVRGSGRDVSQGSRYWRE